MKQHRSIDAILNHARSCGVWIEHLPAPQMTPLRHTWIDLFMPPRMARQAKESTTHLDWHLFSHQQIPFISGDDAQARFQRKKKSTQLAWTSDVRWGGFRIRWPAEVDPVHEIACWHGFHGLWQDVIVTDEEYRWAYAITHEQDAMGLGPYFADRPTRL
jgi:hypothetical protein